MPLFGRGAAKPPGSVEYSMKWLGRLAAIVIDPERCPRTAKEFSEYEFERDKDGNLISAYPDAKNHHIDAVRYGMQPVWKQRGEYGAGTLSFRAYIEDTSDSMTADNGKTRRWGNLSVQFYAQKPQRRPA